MKLFSILSFTLACISLASAQSKSARLVVRNIQDLTKSSADLSEMCRNLNDSDVLPDGSVWMFPWPSIEA